MYQGSYGRIIVKEENGISLTPMRGEGFETCYSGKGGEGYGGCTNGDLWRGAWGNKECTNGACLRSWGG